jgi:hypothetical protein
VLCIADRRASELCLAFGLWSLTLEANITPYYKWHKLSHADVRPIC